ncbi:uncharacterized protein F4812DRAFT_428425 [Daldinia caldariorum]|uniref:uncharacterized protein n=1 Tax=Daldinia caldariorum TaxID=326644 RepID=UPI002007FEB2|nr:uncharacterized protein F4812DRAFT_428425 [Daldinia caldariorum]KAI1468002.1 hypothetical protein F4812DRAFT_428425 [Daldinia caldariorum]
MATSVNSASAQEAAGPLALRKGQELYAQEDYGAAAKLFKKAMNCCSCQIPNGMILDLNEEILTGIENNQLKDTLSALTSRTKRCDKQVHVRAVDALIATYEMWLKLDKCLDLAVGMVNLAPREPKAYLRLGKILRLQGKQTLAYHMYRQGIELVERKYPHHPLLPKLRIQRDKVATLAAYDPVKKFPVELIRMTFEFLDFKSLCRCLRVSKPWNNVLTKSDALRSLWCIQSYKLTQRSHPGIRRMLPSFKLYNKYSKNALRELSIDGLSHFLQWCKFSQVLEISQQLKVLKIRDPRGSAELDSLPPQFRLPQLTHLFMGYGVRPQLGLLERLVNASQSSLEELSIFELPDYAVVDPDTMWHPGWAKLEKLRVIRLGHPVHKSGLVEVPDLRDIIELTPNVEEAWIDNVRYSAKLLMTKWPKLRNLFVGDFARLYRIAGEDDQDSGFNEDMRELHFEGPSLYSRFGMYSSSVVVSSPHPPWLLTVHVGPSALPQLRRLERLSILLTYRLETSEFESIARPSLESGTLRELDIRPLPVHALFGNAFEIEPPNWFRSESIIYLSITGLTAANLCQHRDCDKALLTLISRFPNLRSIDVSNEQLPDTLLAKFIKRGVKTIYHRAKQSKADLQEWAASHHNAQVISRAPAHLPSMHPDRQRFFNTHLQFWNNELS